MKLLTINTHAWLEENQDEKMEILAKTIAEKQYDVITMELETIITDGNC